MGKITIDAGSITGCQPGGEHITRIMYDDNEPPKNFIWGKPNGLFYIWNGSKWVMLNERVLGPAIFNPNDYFTKDELEEKLRNQKNEIVAILRRYIEARACQDCGGDDDVDHSQFITADTIDINNSDSWGI